MIKDEAVSEISDFIMMTQLLAAVGEIENGVIRPDF